MPPGVTTKASEVRTKWCRREKKVPQPEDGVDEDLLDGFLVRQADGARGALLTVGSHRRLQVG
jgi:hypothetical protein